MDGRPRHGPFDLHGFMDSAWGNCLKTRRSFGGADVRLSGGPVAYKSRLHPTVAHSSTEAEFMEASATGRMILFTRSIMWDLGVPQHAATVAYEDNDAATAMANAQKPTPRTRHIDIKHFVLAEWVEQDLIKLERIDTSRNIADQYTKQLPRVLFHRHADYVMGRIPPEYSPCYQHVHDRLMAESSAPPTQPSFAVPDCPAAAAAAKCMVQWNRMLAGLLF